MKQRVAILGASNKPDRYAYRAFTALRERGHEVLPVAPALNEIEGVGVVKTLAELSGPIDTLTLYVNPQISTAVAAEIIRARPGRVLFNPGTENPVLAGQLDRAGIAHEDACTLVLLATNQF
jgi:hypothetical protein